MYVWLCTHKHMQSFIITYNLVNFVIKKSSGALVNLLFSKFLWMEQHASLIIIKWYKANFLSLRWHRTVHVWLHHKNFNAYFGKSTINSLFKGVYIYKVLVYLSSPANQIVLLCVKRKLEILDVWKNTKRIHNFITLNFGLTTIYLPIYKWAVLVFPLAFSFQECSVSGLPSSLSNFFKRSSLPDKSSYQKSASAPL